MLDLVLYSGDGCLAIDKNHRIILWNVTAQQLLATRPEEAIGRRCYEVLRGRDEHDNPICHPGCRILKAAKKGERIPSCDLVVPSGNGGQIWLSMSTLVVARETLESALIVHLFRDVDQRRRLERLARRTIESVSELTEAPVENPTTENNGSYTEELTPRELEVLKLIVQGADAKAIAINLFVSEGTARKHTQSILTKLHVHSRVEAAVFALQHHLITVDGKRASRS